MFGGGRRLEMAEGCERGNVPLGPRGLRQDGSSRATRCQCPESEVPRRLLLCAGSQVCPQGESKFGIRGVGLDQVKSLSKYMRLEKQAV